MKLKRPSPETLARRAATARMKRCSHCSNILSLDAQAASETMCQRCRDEEHAEKKRRVIDQLAELLLEEGNYEKIEALCRGR